MNTEDDLRALLDEAVADVEPHHGLDEIRARTASTHSRRPWVWGAGAAVLATAATVAAVAVIGGGPGTTDAGPGFSAGSSTSPTGAGPTSATDLPGRSDGMLPVYFVGDTGAGPRLFRELHPEPAGGRTLDVAVDEAVSGRAQDPDYRTPWPEGTTLQRAQLSEGVLSVDLSGVHAERPSGMTQDEAELALQQLVHTAQAVVQQPLPITFLVDGKPTSTLLGVPTAQPVRAAAADDVLAPVSVSSPADGATVSSPFDVTGQAAAFEANVQWELMQGGTVVKRGATTAEECCTLSPYSFEVTAPPGDYTVVVHDEDPSGGEGHPPSQDTKRIQVR